MVSFRKLFVVMLCLLTSVVRAEVQHFSTDVNKMLNIIVNSLYKDKDIFIRELVSNSSDALGKLQLQSKFDKSFDLPEWKYEIVIKVDKDERCLIIQDTGIGMDINEMTKNLGTLAHSGTELFVKKLEEAQDKTNTLIGQFGMGFYSAFLVADHIKVISLPYKKEKCVWESTVNTGLFEVRAATDADNVEDEGICGTTIVLKIREGEEYNKYLETSMIANFIKKHMQFIKYPIYLYLPEVVEKKDEKKDEKDEEKKDEEKETVLVRSQINDTEPLWTVDPSTIKKEDYVSFYKKLTTATDEPLAYSHFTVDGTLSRFTGLIYIPAKPSFQAFTNDEPKDFLGLYMKSVLITNDFKGHIARHYAFIQGVVDVESIPLNVSRETLQETTALKEVSKMIQKKTIAMVKKLSEDAVKYTTFIKEFGNHLRLGAMSEEDKNTKETFLELLRFKTTKEEFTSLDGYISRFVKDQEDIYYIAAGSEAEAKSLPYIKPSIERGIEVVMFIDTYDEHMISSIVEYKNYKFKSLSKAGTVLPGSLPESEELKKELEPFCTYVLDLFKAVIDKVDMSDILGDSSMSLVASNYGWTPSMEKLMNNAQNPFASIMKSMKKTMLINPKHPLIKAYNARITAGDKGEELVDELKLLYQAAMLRSGYAIMSPSTLSERIENVMRKINNVEKNTNIADEISESNPAADMFSNLGGLGKDKMDEDADDSKDASFMGDDVTAEESPVEESPVEESPVEESPAEEKEKEDL